MSDYISEGIERGRNPNATARQIVGVYNRATKKREGGIVGLRSDQMKAVQAARDELANPGSLRAYLRRTARDKRYDRTVKKAIREKRALTAADIDKITKRYADRLLAVRGKLIARTETQRAVHMGAHRAYQQLIETGAISENQIRKVWKATGDIRTRDSHMAMSGDSVGFSERFQSPVTGGLLLHPGDPDAPASETANCRCWMQYRIDRRPNV